MAHYDADPVTYDEAGTVTITHELTPAGAALTADWMVLIVTATAVDGTVATVQVPPGQTGTVDVMPGTTVTTALAGFPPTDPNGRYWLTWMASPSEDPAEAKGWWGRLAPDNLALADVEFH